MLSVDVEKLYPAAKTLVKARAASRIHAMDAIQAFADEVVEAGLIRFCLSVRAAPLRRP